MDSLSNLISLVDYRNKKIESKLESKFYFLANELGGEFRIKPEKMIPLVIEYITSKRYHQ